MRSIGQNNKTLYSTVQESMLDEIVAFHNKGNIFVDAHFHMHMVPYAVKLEQLQQLERTDFEILPFHDQDISCVSQVTEGLRRDRSAQKFSKQKIKLIDIKSLLQNAFFNAEDGSRPYPSGGALYPVEVICAIYKENLAEESDIESGFYHYRATQNVLQPLKLLSSEKMRDVIYRMEVDETGDPAFSVIYLAHVMKMLVKYRFRGYRYALMETGAMFHQADLVAKQLGLTNKLYSGFNDHELTHLLGLDKLNFIPLLVQSFGGNQ